jgi:hypothetical protein
MYKTALAAIVSLGVLSVPVLAKSGVKTGVLDCDVSAGVGMIIGSSKTVHCTFKKGNGSVEHYEGKLGKLGVDIGVTNEASMAWIVFAPGKVGKGALAGSYTGATAEATVVAGLGANVLVGGFEKSINLQPVSVSGKTGLNVAAGLASLSLDYAD